MTGWVWVVVTVLLVVTAVLLVLTGREARSARAAAVQAEAARAKASLARAGATAIAAGARADQIEAEMSASDRAEAARARGEVAEAAARAGAAAGGRDTRPEALRDQPDVEGTQLARIPTQLADGQVWLFPARYFDYSPSGEDRRELELRLLIPLALHKAVLAALMRDLDEGVRPVNDVLRLLVGGDPLSESGRDGAVR